MKEWIIYQLRGSSLSLFLLRIKMPPVRIPVDKDRKPVEPVDKDKPVERRKYKNRIGKPVEEFVDRLKVYEIEELRKLVALKYKETAEEIHYRIYITLGEILDRLEDSIPHVE